VHHIEAGSALQDGPELANSDSGSHTKWQNDAHKKIKK
jgi:hypothetical protein